MDDSIIDRAADVVASAQALVIGAGAGMSVDAGIPAYRLSMVAVGKEALPAVPAGGALLFTLNPAAAWGRTGSLLALFRATRPHHGYEILLRWARRPEVESYVVTSNVDGLFIAAGFTENQVLEGHGTLHFLQCTKPCGPEIWSAADYQPDIDDETGWARPPLPTCPRCGEPARPNCFYFGDRFFNPDRAQAQVDALERWLATVLGQRVAVVECGAGTAVPTIRNRCEEIAHTTGGTLIRINPGEPRLRRGRSPFRCPRRPPCRRSRPPAESPARCRRLTATYCAHYATFKLADGVTFVHIAAFSSKEKQAVLFESPPFLAFQKDLKDRLTFDTHEIKMALGK